MDELLREKLAHKIASLRGSTDLQRLPKDCYRWADEIDSLYHQHYQGLELSEEEIKSILVKYGWKDSDMYGHDKAIAHVATLKASLHFEQKIEEAVKAENERMKQLTWCAYCGKEFPLDTVTADQVGEHIQTCKKHPLFHAKRQVAEEILREFEKRRFGNPEGSTINPIEHYAMSQRDLEALKQKYLQEKK